MSKSEILDASLSNPLTGGPSFSLKNRLTRLVWGVVWALLCAWTPPPLHAWRRFWLVLFGARMASSAKVYGSARVWLPANLDMAAYSAIGPRAIVYNMDMIRLEPYALVSQGAHLCAGSHYVDDPRFQLYARPILIKAHAWIAAEAFIGPGVIVEEGAVLGARAVTMANLDAWTIYRGNPASPLRKRSADIAAHRPI